MELNHNLINETEHERIFQEAKLWPHCQRYNREVTLVFGRSAPAPNYFLHGSWEIGSTFGDMLLAKMLEVTLAFEESLIVSLQDDQIMGSIVEFGVFQGNTLKRLIEKAEAIDSHRLFYGFDSFEGLSEPSSEHDYDCWHKGQFATAYDFVADNLALATRPNVKLIQGWIEDTLKSPEALAIDRVAYARIDVDIYPPTVDCLNFLSNRMANGSILVFDDWAYTVEKGESKAFFDWLKQVPYYRFEFLAQCNSRFYLRVHHR
jgi:hypothetical protein